MNLNRTAFASVLVLSVLCASVAEAQLRASRSGRSRKEKDDSESQSAVVIKRHPLVLTDPREYRVPLQLAPIRALKLTARADGVVRSVIGSIGKKMALRAEILRLDDARLALLLQRAKANFRAAQIEQKLARAKGDSDVVALAEARMEAAKAELDLAEFDLDNTTILAPFEGYLLKINVVEGQFVRAGEVLAMLADTSQLTVEIPVDRTKVQQGQRIDLKVETVVTEARVVAVGSPQPSFEPLRELVDSLASATLVIDNARRKFQTGQAVYADIIPQEPIVVLPIMSVFNQEDGSRKVQIIREHVVRDVTVTALAQIGNQRIFAAGRFAPGDEVIVSASQELPDGTQLRPRTGTESKKSASGRRSGSGSSTDLKAQGGF